MATKLRGLAFAAVLSSAPLALAQEGAGQGPPEHANVPHVGGTQGAHGEHEGDHEGHHLDPKTLAFQLLNFGVLLFILIKFGGAGINKALKARHDQLKADLEEANRLRTDAERRYKEQEGRLGNLQSEIAALRGSMKENADKEKARLVAAAEEKAKRIQDETRFQLDQQVKDAQLRLRGEVASAAVKIADELLRRSVTPQDEQRFAQNFVAELGTGRAGLPGTAGPDGEGGGSRTAPRPAAREESRS